MKRWRGSSSGVIVDEETLVKEYFTAMDWDIKTGKPSRNKLTELGLGDIAKELRL